MNPREDLGLLAHIVYSSRARYTLGTVAMRDEPMRVLEASADRLHGPIVVPVWAYIHGAVMLTATRNRDTRPGYPFTCPWDAGSSGFAYCTREEARAYFGWKPNAPITAARRACIVAHLIADVEAFSAYLNGDESEAA